MVKSQVDIYVTGSNLKFLSNDIAIEFIGRGEEIKICPYSFKEIVQYFNLKENEYDLYFDDYYK
ncbi:AAA family ATPase [Mycoplasmopsis fermentans]|uniref:AAA family ATPase n=1 Tax=Mycoplasmopsis fermentans TaxID=2115 RepID=UPI003A5C7F84